MANTKPSVPKLFKMRWCSNPKSMKIGERGRPSIFITNEYIHSVGIVSIEAIYISQPKKSFAFYGRLTLKSGRKITSCYALIISHKHCSEYAYKKFSPTFMYTVIRVPMFKTFSIYSNVSFSYRSEYCFGTGFKRI